MLHQPTAARPTRLELAVGGTKPIRVWLIGSNGQAADVSTATGATLILSDGSSAFYTKAGTVSQDGYARFTPTAEEANDWPVGSFRGVVWIDYGSTDDPTTSFDVWIEEVPQP